MDTRMVASAFTRIQVVKAMMSIRHEWETAAGGESLLVIHGSVGLLLYDLARALGLGSQDLRLALGDDLVDQLAEAMNY